MTNTATIHQFKKGQQAMPSSNGYVNLWRDINKQEWASDALLYGFFTKMLTLVQHKPYSAEFKGVQVELQAGEYALDYTDAANMFSAFRDKRHARTVIAKFVKLGQMYTRPILDNKVNVGLVIGFSGWKKWQKIGTPSGTPSGTPKVTDLAAYKGDVGTPSGTPSGTHINNNDLNKEKDNAGSLTPQQISELRTNAFEYFWKVWSKCKKTVNSENKAPKAKTYSNNFAKLFPDSYIARIGSDDFKAEINAMCQFAATAHQDIAEKDEAGKESPYFNHRNMWPAKFLGNKQWRDGDDA